MKSHGTLSVECLYVPLHPSSPTGAASASVCNSWLRSTPVASLSHNFRPEKMEKSLIRCQVSLKYSVVPRDQSRYAPSQSETSLQCNDVSHWLGAHLDWSLCAIIMWSTFFTKSSQVAPHSLLVRVRYGVSLLNLFWILFLLQSHCSSVSVYAIQGWF